MCRTTSNRTLQTCSLTCNCDSSYKEQEQAGAEAQEVDKEGELESITSPAEQIHTNIEQSPAWWSLASIINCKRSAEMDNLVCMDLESGAAGDLMQNGRHQYNHHHQHHHHTTAIWEPKCSDYDSVPPPSFSEVVEELGQLLRNALPLVLAGLLLYPRGMISMYFLGRLGELELAGGSLSIAFANITGYSVLYGLALGMEPICGQAYGAKQWKLMALTTQRAIIGLFCASLPIACLWINMKRILILCGQDASVTATASIYILFSVPDLAVQCLLHPLRIYLRSQNITIPLSTCAALALPLHVLANVLLVNVLHLGIRGVALAAVWTNINMLMFFAVYLKFFQPACRSSSLPSEAGGLWSFSSWKSSCITKEWAPLIKLAVPSCISVCLEWWWYEFMIMLSGLLVEAQASVATMGILIQITALVYIFPSSLGLAVSTRVSNELGANRPAKARLAVMVASCCAVVLGVFAMAFTTTIRHAWGRMFTNDETILRLTAMALPIVGLCELGNSPQTTGCGVLRGSARPSIGVKINLASFYIIGMPVSIILVFGFQVGFVGLWLGLLAAQATCAISMLLVMARTNWLLEAERSKGLTKASSSSADMLESGDQISSKMKGCDIDQAVVIKRHLSVTVLGADEEEEARAFISNHDRQISLQQGAVVNS